MRSAAAPNTIGSKREGGTEGGRCAPLGFLIARNASSMYALSTSILGGSMSEASRPSAEGRPAGSSWQHHSTMARAWRRKHQQEGEAQEIGRVGRRVGRWAGSAGAAVGRVQVWAQALGCVRGAWGNGGGSTGRSLPASVGTLRGGWLRMAVRLLRVLGGVARQGTA